MAELSTTIVIGAPSAIVWRALTDFHRYGEWNPLLPQITGELRVGAKLAVRLAVPGKPPITVRPTITTLEPERRLIWRGFALAPGFFDGEHGFELTPSEDGRECRLTHAERFEGVLVPVVGPLILASTRLGFIAMNEALRARAEAMVTDASDGTAGRTVPERRMGTAP